MGIAGLSSILLEYLLFGGHIGFESTGGVLLGKYAALLVCVVFAIILIRKLNNGISLMRCMFSGLMIGLIASSVSTAGYTAMTYPDGAFIQEAKSYTIQTWKDRNANDPEELKKEAEVVQRIEDNYSVRTHAFFELTGYVVGALIFSLFTAVFVAKRSSLTGNYGNEHQQSGNSN